MEYLIRAGSVTIPVKSVYGKTEIIEEDTRQMLEVVTNIPLTFEQMELLKTHTWQIFFNGDLQGNHDGYSEIIEHRVIFVRPLEETEELRQLRRDNKNFVEIAIPALLHGINDDRIIMFLNYISEWREGEHIVGEVCKRFGHPYICIKEHTSLKEERDKIPEFGKEYWIAYRSKNKEFALPYSNIGGSSNLYLSGEWMIWKDGEPYMAKIDTDLDPEKAPEDWVKDSFAREEVKGE